MSCCGDVCCPAGEYVAVEHIESVLGKTEVVEQVWVYGSSFESVLVAVVVPKQPALMAWAESQVRAQGTGVFCSAEQTNASCPAGTTAAACQLSPAIRKLSIST
jgi:long-chain acyl-CoA synthetase